MVLEGVRWCVSGCQKVLEGLLEGLLESVSSVGISVPVGSFTPLVWVSAIENMTLASPAIQYNTIQDTTRQSRNVKNSVKKSRNW